MGLPGWTQFAFAMLPSIPNFIANRPSIVDKRIKTVRPGPHNTMKHEVLILILQFINKIKAEKKYDNVGVVGYCFGGAAVVRLAVVDIVDAAVVCHPGGFSIDLVDRLAVPTAWVCAEGRYYSSPYTFYFNAVTSR